MKDLSLLLFLLVISCSSNSRKKSIAAGYKSGSIINYTIEIFEDSTVEMSNFNKGYWRENGDTIFLFDNETKDSVAGLIINNKGIAINKSYRLIESLRFRRFDPSKVVDFPKP